MRYYVASCINIWDEETRSIISWDPDRRVRTPTTTKLIMIRRKAQQGGVLFSQAWKEQQELEKVHDRDFAHNWVSSSGFLFYLQVFCVLAAVLGGCTMLYTKRFEKPEVKVQESTLYTPQYK